eukprot:2750060-Lingulodinium_polyedra.AAC.1
MGQSVEHKYDGFGDAAMHAETAHNAWRIARACGRPARAGGREASDLRLMLPRTRWIIWRLG